MTEKSNPTVLRAFNELEQTIAERRRALTEQSTADISYTAQLLSGGIEKIGAKVIEEATELVEAAGEPGEAGREHTVREAADLIYHLMVLLCQCDIRLADVETELHRRQGVSGLEEKASREK